MVNRIPLTSESLAVFVTAKLPQADARMKDWDPMLLGHDSMGLLTRGVPVAAIGSSDTRTVAFAAIGQARTYIDVSGLPGDWRSDLRGVVARLAAGRNLVSFGLAAELKPVWQSGILNGKSGGRKYAASVNIPIGNHDTRRVAVTTGLGVLEPFWQVLQPAQPAQEDWNPSVLGQVSYKDLYLGGD